MHVMPITCVSNYININLQFCICRKCLNYFSLKVIMLQSKVASRAELLNRIHFIIQSVIKGIILLQLNQILRYFVLNYNVIFLKILKGRYVRIICMYLYVFVFACIQFYVAHE